MHRPFQILRILAIATASLSFSSLAMAGATKITVAVSPQKDTNSKKQKGPVTKEITKFQYSVKLTNASFANVSGLRAEYHVFVRDDSGKGSLSQQKLKKQSFQTVIPDMINGATYTFVTEPVKLETTKLDSNYFYNDGKRGKSEDKILGFWIRIFQGDKVVGEYLNPSSLATKEQF